MRAEFFFEVYVHGSPITGLCTTDHGAIDTITLEDGSEVAMRNDGGAVPNGKPEAEVICRILYPRLCSEYAEQIAESAPRWQKPAGRKVIELI